MNHKLKLETTCADYEKVEVYGQGNTLVQALADVERALIDKCGPEAAFDQRCCFLNRDITSIVDDLDEIGGEFSCSDFSDPEGAFIITRLTPQSTP